MLVELRDVVAKPDTCPGAIVAALPELIEANTVVPPE
jgi:hypothetical protein